jgi:hypothetical protein
LPDTSIVKPQSLMLKFLDRVLDPLIEATVGSGRFEGDERETLRDRLKGKPDRNSSLFASKFFPDRRASVLSLHCM